MTVWQVLIPAEKLEDESVWRVPRLCGSAHNTLILSERGCFCVRNRRRRAGRERPGGRLER